MTETLLGGRVLLHCGDCRAVLAGLEPDSIDAVVTDPPYHLTSIVQRFGTEDAAPPRFKTGAYGGGFKESNGGTGAAFARMSRGFMGKQWDGGAIAFDPETWRAVARVLKPGGHLIAMGGTRTFHRLACAIEDAGFEIRDTISWLYGSGFPKSHDVSKGIDRAAGAVRTEIVGVKPGHEGFANRGNMSSVQSFKGTMGGEGGFARPWMDDPEQVEKYHQQLAPATDAARQWEGWGTALKPACELIVLARKPLSEGTVAANVLRWGTGAINVDGCRVATDEALTGSGMPPLQFDGNNHRPFHDKATPRGFNQSALGRWPANVAHDGSAEVTAAFPDDAGGGFGTRGQASGVHNYGFDGRLQPVGYGDTGSAARFFYTAKADADDRLGSKHPTVKPLDLMQWLVRLVTPKGGTVLDPFAGTGTSGEAAWREGAHAVLIEAEAEYQADIRRRMVLALAGPDERSRESVKAKGLPYDPGPLFGGADPQGGHVRKVYGEFDHDKTGKRYEKRDEWAEMWSKPFDFSREPTT